MKLIWLNTKKENGTTTWDFGCAWVFLLALAVIVGGVWYLIKVL